MSRVAQHHRSGAALIIAIVVLAALLMLGLPFLFTQSGSLSGTRSYAHSELANIGQDSAQSMGVKAGAEAVGYHWQKGGMKYPRAPASAPLIINDWTSLFYDLRGHDDPQSGVHKMSDNLLSFDTRNHAFALPGGNFLSGMDSDDRDIQLRRYPIVVGLTIEDESGKLNPNYLDAVAWSRLLDADALKISDWVNATPAFKEHGRNQLARALAALRYQLAGGRITSLDQLLQAEPPAQPNARRGLTRSELELLRPYLSLSVPSQARGGMIDLGTVIGSSDRKISIDSTQPAGLIAFPITPLVIGVGTTVLAEDNTGVIHALPVTGDDEAVVPKIGDPLAIDAPPLVNVHQAEAPVRKVLAVKEMELPIARPAVVANPSARPPVPAKLLAPALISELDSYSSTRPLDALLHTRSWFELTSPLSIPEELGSADVVDALNGAPIPVSELAPDAANVPRKVLLASSTLLVISGESLDHFPNQGYALLRGTFAAGTLPAPNDKPEEYVIYDARGALPQNVSANSTVQVHVRRFQNPVTPPPGKAAQAFKIENLKFIAIASREQHPVGIASQGVITIASAATVTDPAGNQTAQQQHRVIAQALPQETLLPQKSPLEARWNKQAAFHALLAQRHGSLMTTFPKPYPRITDLMPDDPANNVPSASVPTDLDDMAGIRPAVMRTLFSSSHLSHEWRLPLSGDKTDFLNAFGTSDPSDPYDPYNPYLPLVTQPPINYSNADVNRMTPEGLRLDASRVLSYPNDSSAGLIPDSYNATKRLAQIKGRQFGLWVRPDATWTGQVALLDMRIPSGNLDKILSGNLTGVLRPDESTDERKDKLPSDTSDVDVCNRFTLVYDAVLKQMVLVLNPGTIPHTADYGPKIPRETYGPTTGVPLVDNIWPAVNPECLGSGGTFPMASASPATSIQHRYALGPAFIPETWHLIQVAFSSNLPGGMSIIVDGLVGRDVTLLGSTATPPIPAAMTLPGDHLTLPSLVLREELLATPSVSTNGTGALYQEKIQLDACAQVGGAMVTGGPAVKALLPERGMVRIGNEYISYQSIDANGVLMDCVRARRQRTDAQISYNAMNQPIIDWSNAHKLETHAVGAQVLPGGFAISELSRPWWRGGCSLAQMMPDGDPIHQYQVHAAVTTEFPLTVIPAGSLGLTLSGEYLGDFPMRGYVMVNNSQLFYYDNVDKLPILAKGLVNTSHWVRSLVVPDPKDPDKTIITDEWRTGIPADIPVGSTVVLVSVELKGDPTTDRAYHLVRNNGSNPWTSQSADAPVMVQLYDARSAESAPNGGRAEWLTYSSIDSRTTYLTSVGTRVSFLLNITSETKEVEIIPSTNPKTYYSVTSYRPGFWFDPNDRSGARGRERTAFAKTDLKTYSPADHRFPIGTRVIPVQTNFANAQLLEAGDMVTLAPVVMGTAVSGQRPLQMCVRYSAHDGFPETTTSTSWPWHVTSGNFAFTEAIPDTWNPNNSNFHLLCWPCWTPEIDLSAIQTNTWQTHRQGWVLPWGNAYAPDFDPVLRKGEITFLTDANSATGKAGMIDAIHAGAQAGWQQERQVQAHILASSDAIWLDDQPLRERTVVVANQGIFTNLYGIVEIGGETFAYKQWDNESDPFVQSTTQAWLIGRSLLGSTARIHKGPELILRLPIGPVTEVIGTISAAEDLAKPLSTVARSKGQMGINFIGPLNLASDPNASFNSPAVLLTSRDGREQEITLLPNNHTAPWLRGMYNTTPVGWEDRPKVPAITSPPTDGSQPPPLPSIPNLAPLAIGWWPRYPSGYPKDLSTRSPVERSAFLRCRSYAWAGFPLRFHDAQFSGTDLAEVTVLSTGGGLFDLQALALDGRMDWSAATMVPLDSGANTDSVTAAFASSVFKVLADETLNKRLINEAGAIRTVDGAELRVVWTYRDKPLIEEKPAATPSEWLQDTALSGNSAPMIGPVYLRARAPNKIISVER